MTPRKTTRSKATTRKTTKITLARTPNVKISFSTKNPSAKPPISAAKARQLIKKIEAIKVVAAASTCDEGTCAQVTEIIKGTLDAAARCSHSCQWFYSRGGGWQLECYFRCTGQYMTCEGTYS